MPDPSDSRLLRPMTSLWQREARPVSTHALPARTQVAVIGAGIAGISTALHLAERGADVTVLDREGIAARASGRNDGQLLLGLGEHYHRIHGQFGSERAQRLWAFLQRNHDLMLARVGAAGIDCGLVQKGGLRLAETAHEAGELHTAAELLAREGKPHQLLTAGDVRRWLPPAEGFHGALFLPGEAIAQPVHLVQGLAHAAATAGAHLVTGAPVVAVDGDAGNFVVRLADGRALAADAVVHCTSALAPGLDHTGFLRRCLFPFRGQVIATDPLPPELAAAFPDYAMSSNFCYEYFRVSRGRFVIGGKRWAVPGEELGILDDASHNPAVTAHLLDYVATHFPALAGIPFPHVWTGIMAGTPDGLPLLGALPGQSGAFALLGFNGYGLSFAFLAGRCLADMVLDGQSDEPAVDLFAPRRLTTNGLALDGRASN
jgi:glycine/D-amino acid oxidase-like deaminating enzyme